MMQCEFCGASMADTSNFCGKCGRVPSQTAHRPTRVSYGSTIGMEDTPDLDDENQTILSASGKHMVPRSPSGMLRPVTLLPIDDNEEKEDEEEQRRRAALFGMGLPLLEEIANAPTLDQAPVMPGTPPLAQTPMLQGTPQIAHVPNIPGVPHMQGGPFFGPGSAAAPPPFQQVYPPQPLYPPPAGRPSGLPGNSPQRPPSNSSGCLPLGAVFIAAILIILATTFGLGLTVLAPNLSLSGKSAIVPGSNITIYGQHFLPNSSVTLTLDSGTPLYSAYAQFPTQARHERSQNLASAGLTLATFQQAAATNIVSAHGDGTFNASIQISATITPGVHAIHATEGISHRSASLTFTIPQANATPTATPTATEPAPTATATATPTPTTVTPPALSCVSPGNMALGPISELSSQITSGGVTLCTSGTGTLNWKATWDQNHAPWLQVGQSNGTVQAPDQIQTTISASAKNLTAGTYTATVTFIALESNTTQVVNITLAVKAGCVSATPQNLRFSGVSGVSNPGGSQDVSVSNCGLTSNWSASINNGGNWLNLDTNSGTLKGGDTTTTAVTASNLKAGLKAGTYQATITFTIGSDTTTVNVTLVVQPAPTPTPTPTPPTISVNPVSVDANTSACTSNANGSSSCTITLTNNSSTSSLTWSANPSVSGVSVQASTTTIAAGGTEQVTIVVPAGNCGKTVTVTFTAPGNTASVTWNCALIQ